MRSWITQAPKTAVFTVVPKRRNVSKTPLYHICQALGSPVVNPKTPLPFDRISMGSRHRMGKSRCVDEDNGPPLCLMFRDLLAEHRSFFGIPFGVFEGFFYNSHRGVLKQAISHYARHQTVWRFPKGLILALLLESYLHRFILSLSLLIYPKATAIFLKISRYYHHK